jgi:hypothetical protein
MIMIIFIRIKIKLIHKNKILSRSQIMHKSIVSHENEEEEKDKSNRTLKQYFIQVSLFIF